MQQRSQGQLASDNACREVDPLSGGEDALSEWQRLAAEVEQRQRAEAALRESDERFRSMFQLASVGMAQLDARTGRFAEVNPRFCELTGYSIDELRRMSPVDLDHPDDVAADRARINRLLSGEAPEYFNVKRYVRKDGRVIWVQVNGSLIRDAGGRPVRTIAIVHDVTDRQRAEEKLQSALRREQAQARQLRGLSEAALAIRGDRPVGDMLQEVTDRARLLIGAHQAVTSFTVDLKWSQAISGLSLSDKYAQYRTYNVPPDGSGIYALVCEANRPIRMTQAELEAHPRWRGFGQEAGKHPPMRGWLAAPLIAQDGSNLGLIELSDKFEGDFTAEDEAVLVQLAQLISAALDVRRGQEVLERRVEDRTAELRRSRERLDLALKSARIGTWDWNLQADVVIWDDYMYPLFGLQPGEFDGTYDAFARLLTEEDRQRVGEEVGRAIREGRDYDAEFHVTWPDRSVHVIAARGKVYRNDEGTPVQMTGVCWDVTERRQSEAIHRALIDQSANFIGLLTPEGRIVDANRTALAAARVAFDDVQGRLFWETPWWSHSPELQERLKQSIRLVAQGKSDRFEATHPVPDNGLIDVDFTLKPVIDATGRTIYLIPEGRDITEHKRRDAEHQRLLEELAAVASRLALPDRGGELRPRTYRLDTFSLTDMMDCGAVIRGLSTQPSPQQFAAALVRQLYDRFVDAEGRRACALVRLFEVRRFDELDAIQRRVARSALPEIAPETRCLTLVATAGDEPAWNDIRHSQGHQAVPLPSADAVRRLPMVSQLIRQLGMPVHGVLQADSNLLVSGSETGVFYVEQAAGSPYVPAQTDFVQRYGIQSVVGFGDLLPGGRLFAVILFAKVTVSRETAALFGHLAQSTRMALLSHADIPNRTEAQIVSLDRLLRNHERLVAEQERRLQATLQRLSASNSELEQFAYVASHDLQEPLRKILAFGNLLSDAYRDQLGDEGRDYLQRMQRASERMQTLINDLLTLSRVLRKGQPFELVDLNEVVQAVLQDLEARIVATQGSVEVGDLPTLDADPTQMRQLFQNLIGNALKYRRPDVPPVVTVTAEHRPAPSRSRDEPAAHWEITVADNGIGFDPQYAERIFQPFQRLHGRSAYEGTGMGLTICRRITERHGGTIRAEGFPERGARFIVSLPARQSLEDPGDVSATG